MTIVFSLGEMWSLIGVILQGGPPALAAAPAWPFVHTLSNHALMSMSEFAIGVPPEARMPPWASSTVVVAASSAAGQALAAQVAVVWCLPSRTRLFRHR